MARPGLSEEQIRDVIRELEGHGGEVTVTRVREMLGTGSYSTISQVLSGHREERLRMERPTIPEPPEPLQGLLKQLWLSAWQSADSFHTAERNTFTHERALFDKAREEMAQEIARLEDEVARCNNEREDFKHRHQELQSELSKAQLSLAIAQGRLEALEREHENLRTDAKKMTETLAEWVERATLAEARLSEGRTGREKTTRKKGG